MAGCETFDDYHDGDKPVEKVEAVPLDEQPRLDPINRNYFILEDPEQSVIGELQIVFTNEDDTFSDLAREYGLGYDELVAANPSIDPWLPGENTPIVLPTQYVVPEGPRSGIVLNIAAKRLFYFPEVPEGQSPVVMTYPIGIGRVGWETPLGETTVISKARDPVWYVPASVRKEHAEAGDPLPSVVQPGPDNPLGNRVLKLDIPGYLIHGTNQPYGVGMRVSHGCVRLYPENIELLYDLVEIGEDVRIVNEPYLVGYKDGDIYFEGHEILEDDTLSADDRFAAMFEAHEELEDETYQQAVQGIAGEARGIPVRLASVKEKEAFATARIVRNTVEHDPEEPTLDEVRAMMDEEEAPEASAEAATPSEVAAEAPAEETAEPAEEPQIVIPYAPGVVPDELEGEPVVSN